MKKKVRERDPVWETHIWKADDSGSGLKSERASDQSQRGAGEKRKTRTKRQEVDKMPAMRKEGERRGGRKMKNRCEVFLKAADEKEMYEDAEGVDGGMNGGMYLTLDEHGDVHEHVVQFLYAALQPYDVFVTRLDLAQRLLGDSRIYDLKRAKIFTSGSFSTQFCMKAVEIWWKYLKYLLFLNRTKPPQFHNRNY